MELRVIKSAQEIERASVVATLEMALEEARAGKIRGIAIAIVRPDMALNTSWSDSDAAAPLVGAVALLQKRIIQSLDD